MPNTISLAVKSLHWMILVAALTASFIRGLIQFSGGYDYSWYHLPGSLRLLGYTSYHPEARIAACLDGFPPLAHAAQAAMIWLTGHLASGSAANFVGLFITTAMLAYLFAGRISLRWLLTAVLAVPAINIQMGRGFVDLWCNAWLYLAFGSLVYLTTPGEFEDPFRRRAAHLAFAIGVVIAALSKYTMWPLVIPLVLFYAIELWRETLVEAWRPSRVLAWGALLIALLSSWAVRNAVVFGNPTYPLLMPIASSLLTPTSAAKFAHDPEKKPPRVAAEVIPMSRPQAFLYSALELSRLRPGAEPMKWSIDATARGQEVSPHFRLGGFFFITFSLLVVGTLLATVYGGVSRRSLLALAATCGVVMLTRTSYELRYWLILPLAGALVVALSWLHWPRLIRAVMGTLLFAAMIFVCDRVKTMRGIEYTSVEDVAPEEAKRFWRETTQAGRQNEAHIIIGRQPASIFWTGPTLKEFHIFEADGNHVD